MNNMKAFLPLGNNMNIFWQTIFKSRSVAAATPKQTKLQVFASMSGG
jgi:hypothetical protein